jgi:rare lipoprotein A
LTVALAPAARGSSPLGDSSRGDRGESPRLPVSPSPRPLLVLLALLLAARCASRQAPAPAPVAPGQVPPETGLTGAQEGVASWYGGNDGFEGKPTASGEIYNSNKLTAAHRELPFGSIVDVTSVDTGRTVRVRINDRGPFAKGRIIDLSHEAARLIGIVGSGTGRVRLTLVKPGVEPTPVPDMVPWVVQVGSFADRVRAERQADRVRATGRAVFLEPFDGLTRVKIGPYPSRAEAQAALTALESAGFEGIVVPQPAVQ